MSRAFEAMRQQCKEWKYRCNKSEAELEELRMVLHQFSQSKDPQIKATARSYLLAVVRERQGLIDGLREVMQRDH
jgi:hypothetical protein